MWGKLFFALAPRKNAAGGEGWLRFSRSRYLILRDRRSGPPCCALQGARWSMGGYKWYPRSRTKQPPWTRHGRVHALASSSSRTTTCTVTIGFSKCVESAMSADRRVGKTKRATQAHAFACSGDDKIVIPIRVVLGDHRLADMEDLCMKTTMAI